MREDASDPMVIITIFLCFQFLLTVFGGGGNCNGTACPPPSSFPFSFASSSAKGCGHPSFQLDCVTSPPLLTVNNCSFSLIPHKAESNQVILLSLRDCVDKGSSHCDLPSSAINFSGSPFSFSSSSCSRLASLRPCDTDALEASSLFLNSSCSLNRWQRRLLLQPNLLLQGCPKSPSICSRDSNVIDGVRKFLKLGIEVEWDENDLYIRRCRECRLGGGMCGFNDSNPSKPFLCFQGSLHSTPIRWPVRTQSDEAKKKIIIGICGIVVSICFLLVTLLIVIASGYICGKRRKRRAHFTAEDGFFLRRLQYSSSKSNLLSRQHSVPASFTYEELESSTNRFDCKRKLGDGGFGSVFLGQLSDGRMVAVKKLYKDIHRHERHKKPSSFVNEILILSSLDHPNLVRLHGYCTDPRGLLLVYEFVANGTLADHLHGQRRKNSGGLSWRVRLSIAIQIANALEYLHFFVNPPIVHRDITSSNIFLTKDFTVKVGDFGLSRLLPMAMTGSSAAPGSVLTGPQGTPGYLDPDYHRSFILTEKSDVYSFGVVLLELVSGKKAVDTKRERREMGLAELMVSKIQMGSLMEMVDENLACAGGGGGGGGGGAGVTEMVKAVAELAFRCVAGEKDDRPNMREVVDQLKRIAATMEP